MRNIFAVSGRLIRQIISDKRTIGLLLIAPIFVIYLLNIILTSAATVPNIDLIDASEAWVEALEQEAIVTVLENESIAMDRLNDGESNAYIVFSDQTPQVTVDGADPNQTKIVLGAVRKASNDLTQEMLEQLIQMNPQITLMSSPEVIYLYGSEDLEQFDTMAPMMMGYFIFFFVFLIAGISFLRERISGTLERLLASPVRRSQIVLGYFLGFGLFVSIQTVVIETFMIYVLDVEMAGSFWNVLVVNLVLAGGSLALGTLLSAFANNEFQLFQFIPLVIIPQILFSGIFDLTEAPVWVGVLSKVFPMTYGAEALRNIMIRGADLVDVIFELAVLFGYMLLFLILNIFALRKYRKI